MSYWSFRVGCTFVWRYIALYWSRCVLLQNVISDKHDKLTRKEEENIYVVDDEREQKDKHLVEVVKERNSGLL